jgi:hypothetical protein
MTFAVPAATVVTSPEAETWATDEADDDQVTDRPVSTFPAASVSDADACVV